MPMQHIYILPSKLDYTHNLRAISTTFFILTNYFHQLLKIHLTNL